jgi:hypothetical protein
VETPPDFGEFQLELNHTIPIRVQGATWAQIKYVDENGRTSWSYDDVQVADGKVYFPTALAGKTNTFIWIHRYDNGQRLPTLVYQTYSGGVRVLPSPVTIELSPSISGMKYFKDEVWINSIVDVIDGYGVNPTIELELSQVTQNIVVDSRTSGGAFALGCKIRSRGSSEWVYYERPVGYPWPVLNLPAGFYYIVPVWGIGSFKEVERPYYPHNGGGKG